MTQSAAATKPAAKPLRTRRVGGSKLKDPKTGKMARSEPRDVVITGPEAEAKCLLARLAPVYGQHVEFYAREYADVPSADPRKMADDFAEYSREKAAETPPGKLTWRHLSAVARGDGVQAAIEVWEQIKQAAREDVATGTYATSVVFPNSGPFDRAREFALREEMAEGWNPQNGVEHALVDMLAINFNQWLRWTGLAHSWTTGFCEGDGQGRDRLESTHSWKPPRLHEAEAVEQAHRLADSYNRQFLRTLRQLRDLRRYVPPVIVNHGGQVNVANQQVNVTSVD